jgi:hypothetical protein
MVGRRGLFLALVLLVAAGATACEPTEPTEVPTCAESELQAPGDLSPNGESVVLDPSTYLYLSGTYPGTSCEPDYIEAYVWMGLEPETPGMTGRVPLGDGGSWNLPWPIPLEPGNTYYWRAYPGLETGPGDDISGPSTRGYFFTGPVCSDPTVMQPVDLISPADDSTFAVTDDVTFAWDDPTLLAGDDPKPCLVNGLFEIQVSESPEFADFLRRIPILQSVYTMHAADIPLAECTRYYWRVMTDRPGEEGPFSETWSFFVQSPGVLCPVQAPAIPEIPVVTVIPPELPGPPMAEALVDLNCRGGPSQQFRIDDTFFAGASAPIQGRNEDGTWVQILSPNLQLVCWIWTGRAQIQGDIDLTPVIRVPTPEPTPIVCADYTTRQYCEANPACRWVAPVGAPNLAGHCESR